MSPQALFSFRRIFDNLAPPPGKKFHQVLGKLSSRWKNEREGRSVNV